MKFSIGIFLALTLMNTVLSSKPKSTMVYYAKPLHPSGPAKPKPLIYKVIIHDQPAAPKKQQEVYKIVHLPQHGGGGHGDSGGHQYKHGGSKRSVKIFKIIHVKQQAGGGGGGKHSKWS